MENQLEIKTERELKLFVAKNRTSITRINGVEFGKVYPILEVSNNYASYYDVESQGNKFLHAPFSIEFKIKTTTKINTMQTPPSQEVQTAINENNKVLDFIKTWQSKNEYNPKFLDEFNAKFNAEFNDFLKAGNFTAETIKFFTA